jgi:uracil phosphoribosyltransferase
MDRDAQMKRQVNVIGHPLVQHKLTLMRRRETSTTSFRDEVTRDMQVTMEEIETPLMAMKSPVLEGKKIVLISILRAGNGLLDGMLRILPSARVGHVGLYRNHETLEAVEYFFKVPSEMEDRDAIVLDPMLATGNSAVAAVERIKKVNPRSVKFVCLLAAPEGIATFHERHPDVPVYTAAVDQRLNDKGYILPGLGDAGDRLFGTK